MHNTPQLLLREAQLFRNSGNFMAAGTLAREAVLRGGGVPAMELSAQMTACVRAIYGPEALRSAEAHSKTLREESGRFSIFRNTELNLDSDHRYACAKLNKNIEFMAKGVNFCDCAPALACVGGDIAQPLAALRLAAETIRAGLLVNKAGLCGNCPYLKKIPEHDADRGYGPLHINIQAIHPETYDLSIALGHLAEQGFLSPGCAYAVRECPATPQATVHLKKVMAVMQANGLRGSLRTDPEEFHPELFEALSTKHAQVACHMDENSNSKAWRHLRRYCQAGNPDLVSVNLTFRNGSLPEPVLQNFMERCRQAGCRKLSVAFNERLEADEPLLANRDFLEKNAFLLGMDLNIDQESLDAAIFNRKINLQRAQSGWMHAEGGLPQAWRWPRPQPATASLPSVVGQN